MTQYCQRCQKEAASVHVTDIDREGGTRLLHLCEECARSQGVPTHQPPSMLALYKELMEKALTGARPKDRLCPQCGMSFGEFKAKGRFGCAHDYEVFFTRIVTLLERIHGSSEHLSESDAEQAARAAAEAAAHTATQAANAANVELKRLRKELHRVIKAEEYEEAAKIRDRIQVLEKQVEGGGAVHG